MNPPEPQPARRRGRKNRAFHDLLAGLAAAACVLAFMLDEISIYCIHAACEIRRQIAQSSASSAKAESAA